MAQDYDVSLKLLFRRSKGVAIQRLLGDQVEEWLNVELPRVSNPRVDMLARTRGGALCNLEVQSSNSPDMARRQAEYYLDLHRLYGEHVRQVVLYIGQPQLSMSPYFLTPAMRFTYDLVDVRQFDGEALLASGDLGDAMLALLTGVDKEKVGNRVWPEIGRMDPSRREDIVTEFLVISGLRSLEPWVLERARRLMPLSIDVILNNTVLGPAFRRHLEEGHEKGLLEGREKGLREGRMEGRMEGLREGELTILRRLLQSRFGPLSPAVEQRLQSSSEAELTAIADRALTAASIEDLFS